MKELREYLDSLFQIIGTQFQQKEDNFFKIVFWIVSLVIGYELIKWAYQFFDLPKLLILLFTLFLAFVLRKHFGTNTKTSPLVEKLTTNRNHIMYAIFVIFFIFLVLNFVLLGENGLKYLVYFVLGAYVVFKFLGFTIDYEDKKLDFKSENSLYLLVIGGSFLYIVMNFTLEQFEVGNAGSLVYIVTGIIYLAGYSYLFTDIFEVGTKNSNSVSLENRRHTSPLQSIQLFALKNIYVLLVVCCISILLGVMFFRGESSVGEGATLAVVEEELISSEPEIATIVEPEEFRVAIKKVSELYVFSNTLTVGSEGDEVQKLQGFLASKKYYAGPLDGIFDEETRVALRETLIAECDWPETTEGILGPQASDCINDMEVEHKVLLSSEEVIVEATEQDQGNIDTEIDEVLSDIREETPVEEETPAVVVEASTFTETLTLGDSGVSVTALQNLLIRLGYLGAAADGNFDLTTSLALKSALIGQCGFSDDIEGNLDESALQCVNTLAR